MKNILYSVIIIAAIVGCSTVNTEKVNKKSISKVQNDTIRIANDSIDYEIIIFEPGFNAWLATQPSRGFYSQSTMEMSNYLKLTIYNLRVQNPIRYDYNLYPMRIDYDRRIDYGYEVNFMLYNYFLFFEQKYNQKLR